METLPLILEPEQLEPLLGSSELLIVDFSQQESFLSAHVPGAVYVDFKRLLAGTPPAPGGLPSIEQLTALCSEIGLTPNKHVITYDDEGGGWAGRFIWTLDVIGHSKASYLNGGIHAWAKEGHPVSQEAEIATATNYQIKQLNQAVIADKAYIIKRHLEEDCIIWDARSPLEYTGQKVFAEKGGHIPGAINFEWTAGMDSEHNLRIKTDIAETLDQLGITEDKEIITHCQTHHRSGFTYLVAKSLGYSRVKAYPGSWYEWGNSPDTPVECP